MPTIPTPEFNQLPAGAVAYPDARDLFVADQQELAEHLLPLLSFDASLINPEWSARLHLVNPIEPSGGLVGMFTEGQGFGSELLKTNWIGFKIEDGRYRLCGDPRYFFLHPGNAHLADPERNARADLQQHYTEQHAAYQAARQRYHELGHLTWPEDNGQKLNFIEEIGGVAEGYGNWVETVEFPMDIVEATDDSGDIDVWPLSPAGRRFQHVLGVPAYNYGISGADLIVMFYEPVEGLVLFCFDWS
ncbi:MAG: hypothetical protein ACN6QY_14380 [Pseudomonas sp.]|uniref:hypothetical protein n=1 Tax=unclassified Pseudomonas TaxID=196821 RepID=UPI001CFA52DA|nr:hypothetical protein [Pseudomonas sp. L5B5]UCZ83626.1 hypothetical protein LGQ10_25240 [Pseudomonas sp. L5B5]